VGHTPYRSEEPKNPLLKLPPDNRLRTPPVTPWAISLLKPAFIGCINPAVTLQYPELQQILLCNEQSAEIHRSERLLVESL
jgi:hypothetical protein